MKLVGADSPSRSTGLRALLWMGLPVLGAATATAIARRVRPNRRAVWSPPGGRHHHGTLASRVVGDLPAQWLLLHGMFGSGRYWGATYDDLAGDGAVVAPDLLGFGRSRTAAPRAPNDMDVDTHADAVAACLAELGITTPLVVVGHSAGSLVAIRLALRHPNLVAAVVAIAPPLYPSGQAGREHLANADALTKLFLAHPRLSEWVCGLMCRYREQARTFMRATNPSLPRPLADDAVEHTWSSYHGTLEHLVLAADTANWLIRLDCPLHILAGDHDTIVDLDYLEQLTALHDHVTLTTAPGLGHDMPLTSPLVCRHLIRTVGDNVR